MHRDGDSPFAIPDCDCDFLDDLIFSSSEVPSISPIVLWMQQTPWPRPRGQRKVPGCPEPGAISVLTTESQNERNDYGILNVCNGRYSVPPDLLLQTLKASWISWTKNSRLFGVQSCGETQVLNRGQIADESTTCVEISSITKLQRWHGGSESRAIFRKFWNTNGLVVKCTAERSCTKTDPGLNIFAAN